MKRERVSRGWWCVVSLTLALVSCTRAPYPTPVVPERAPTDPGNSAGSQPAPTDASIPGCTPAQRGSPIDIPLEQLSSGPTEGAKLVKAALGQLSLNAHSRDGHLELRGDPAQHLELDGQSHQLSRVELHSPAEHRLGGITAELELTLWFETSGAPALALSLLYRRGQESPTLTALLDALPARGSFSDKDLNANLDLAALLPESGLLFSYAGSETGSSCAPVSRLVLASMGELSEPQLEKLSRAVASTSHTHVPLGERELRLLPLQRSNTAH